MEPQRRAQGGSQDSATCCRDPEAAPKNTVGKNANERSMLGLSGLRLRSTKRLDKVRTVAETHRTLCRFTRCLDVCSPRILGYAPCASALTPPHMQPLLMLKFTILPALDTKPTELKPPTQPGSAHSNLQDGASLIGGLLKEGVPLKGGMLTPGAI